MTNNETYPSVQNLKQLDNGSLFTTVVVVRKINKKLSKNGSPFLQIEVGDAVDSLSFNCYEGSDIFNFFQQPTTRFPQIIKIQGIIDFFADKLSPKIKTIQAIDDASYETYLEQLIEKPEESLDALKENLNQLIAQISYPALAATVQQVFKDLGTGFFDSVAAISMHHAYIHGLLEHTVHVGRVVQNLIELYPNVNADIALAGALLHDVGKVLEYHYSLDGIERTCVGRLQGHVVLGYRLVRSAGLRQKLHPVWLERLEHIILSHQGEPEWGAAVYPSTPEAVLVGLADNLDAKMEMVHHSMKKAIEEMPFSEFIQGLQTRLLTQPLPDPNTQTL